MSCEQEGPRLTYVNKGLLYLLQREDGQLCIMLMPEPGVNGLQGSIGTAPSCIITFVLQHNVDASVTRLSCEVI